MRNSRPFVLLFIVLISALLPVLTASALEEKTADEIIEKAAMERKSERYDQAFDTLQAGKILYPGSFGILFALGDLYFDKELYSLALREYKAAETIDRRRTDLLGKLALTYGHLNQEKTSVRYYELIHELKPDDREAVNDLAWMYFKTHQLGKGEALILEAEKKFGMNRHFAMTLGTIYADLYDYGKSKKYYQFSIDEALRERENRFAAVAFYNLSLLEKSFYHYDEALETTARSIYMEDRAPGHLAKGDLYESRMEFKMAAAEYRQAELMDTTPLSRMNLAVLYRKFGFLKEALAYAKGVFEKKDYSWMYYFGTNRDRFLMDLHELLGDTYKGLAHLEELSPEDSLQGAVLSFVREMKYRVLSGYHALLFRKYAASVSQSYLEKENYLNAWFTFSRANRSFPKAALRYLLLAKEIEIQITPEAERYYLLEEGKIRRDMHLLAKAVRLFSSPWEKENLEDGLIHLIPELKRKGQKEEYLEAVLKLYEINPGALRQNGLRLPVRLSVEGPGASPDRLAEQLWRWGFDTSLSAAAEKGNLPRLEVITEQDGSASWNLTGGYLTYSKKGTAAAAGAETNDGGMPEKSIVRLASAVADSIFSVER